MNDRLEIWTYRRVSGSGKEWFAYIHAPDLMKGTLPVRFEGATEEEARANAMAEYEKRRDEREQVRANRKEAAKKRAMRAAAKTMVEGAS